MNVCLVPCYWTKWVMWTSPQIHGAGINTPFLGVPCKSQEGCTHMILSWGESKSCRTVIHMTEARNGAWMEGTQISKGQAMSLGLYWKVTRNRWSRMVKSSSELSFRNSNCNHSLLCFLILPNAEETICTHTFLILLSILSPIYPRGQWSEPPHQCSLEQ